MKRILTLLTLLTLLIVPAMLAVLVDNTANSPPGATTITAILVPSENANTDANTVSSAQPALAVQAHGNYLDSAQTNSAQTANAKFENLTATTAPESEVSYNVICPTVVNAFETVDNASFQAETANAPANQWSPEVAYCVIGDRDAVNQLNLLNLLLESTISTANATPANNANTA